MVYHDEGRDNVFSSSDHQLSGIHEDLQEGPTTPPIASGPFFSPRRPDAPPLRTPRASSAPDSCCDGDNAPSVHSSPSERSRHSGPSDKGLSDAIFGASDEELSSISDTESDFCTMRPSAVSVQPRRIGSGSDSSKLCTRSQSRRHSHSSVRPTSAPHLSPAQDPAPEQKLVPMVKGLRVMDSQDITQVKSVNNSDRGPAAATKRKRVLPASEDEIEAANYIPFIVKKSSPPAANPVLEKKLPTMPSTARTTIEPRSPLSVAPGQSVKIKKEPLGGKLRSYSTQVADSNLNVSLDEPRTTTPARKVVEGRGVVRAARPLRKRPMTVTQPRDAIPHKRARVGPENISSPRAKSSRRKKGVSVSKPRKSAPPRARKTYRNLPRTEPSSPGHPANRDIDYDEIPPSTTNLNPPTAHERNPPASTTGGPISTSGVLHSRSRHGRTTPAGPPTARPGLANEIAIDKQANGVKVKQADARLIQPPPPEVVLEDDDPIQSFSSSLCESLSVDDSIKVFEIFPIALHVVFILCSLGSMSQLLLTRVPPSLKPTLQIYSMQHLLQLHR